MRHLHAHIPSPDAGWRNAADANEVVVCPAFMAFGSPVVVTSITRQAARKPRPSGFAPGGLAP